MNGTRKSPLHRLQGFSRPDFLAWALLITLLSTLALPLAGNTRIHSKLATCLDNHRRLALAWQMYAGDNAGWFPPNNDDGSLTPGYAWIGGQAGMGGQQEYDHRIAADATRSLLADYLRRDPDVFRCPADARVGIDRSTVNPPQFQEPVPAARSISMNGAVGTNPRVRSGKQPVDGPWLDNNHGHTYGRTWLTYGRESHLTQPGPARTALILDEEPRSINDAFFAFGMQSPEWIDWPATSHDGAGVLSFTDAHVEAHRWLDSRTQVGTTLTRLRVPGSPDYDWLRDRISARKNN